TLPKTRMTKQGNFNQRTPQAKKTHSDLQMKNQQSDSATKQTPVITNSVFTMMGPLLGTTQATTATTSAADLQRAPFTTPHQTVPETDPTEPPPAPLRNKGSDLDVDNLALKGVAPELAPSEFVYQNYETLATLMQEETKKRSSQSLLGRRRSLSESPPSSNSKDSQRKRHKRVSSSSSDSSDNEDEETGHWKSRNGYRNQEDEDMSRPWRRQKVNAFTRHISDFSKDKRRRMPVIVKNYDGTGDLDDHLKIFESAANIKN
nr:reverse transcriptase domain-containing protein [Tanacetum cinerariifolium]